MRSAVRVMRGRWRGCTGTIAGELGALNRHITKVVVTFPGGAITIVPIADLAPAAPPAQLELQLFPEMEKAAAGGPAAARYVLD